jgi:hypothetical protein
MEPHGMTIAITFLLLRLSSRVCQDKNFIPLEKVLRLETVLPIHLKDSFIYIYLM